MKLEEVADEVVETDVLIIGGGLAGLMAAIRAREHNVKVAIIEKAHIRRSGMRGQGIDHYPSIAHPLINEATAEQFGHMRADMLAGLASTKLSVITAENALKPLLVLEDLGLKFREDDGTLIMHGGRLGMVYKTEALVETERFGGEFLFYRGADLKLKLAEEVERRSVDVFNRTMPTSLVTKDGSVIGATAVNVRNSKFLIFKAKRTILATGGANRVYSYPFAPFPLNLFINFSTPNNDGGGIAAAYRAGAELTNMEYFYFHIYAGGLPWWGLTAYSSGLSLVDSKGNEVHSKYPQVMKQACQMPEGFYREGHLAYSPDPTNAEIDRDVWMYDTAQLPEGWEAILYRIYANGDPMMLAALRDRGGLRKAPPLEARVWLDSLARSFSGVTFNERGESSLKGLFIAGDVSGGLPQYGSTGAHVWGYLCGNYAAEEAVKAEKPIFDSEQLKQVQAERERALAPLSRKEGISPLELEDSVRTIMGHYVHVKKVEPKLKRCLELLKVLKERFVPALTASNAHELLRALEVQNIIEIAELHAAASLIRTETRMPPNHYRMDYPRRDDVNWRRNIILKNVAGRMEYTLKVIE